MCSRCLYKIYCKHLTFEQACECAKNLNTQVLIKECVSFEVNMGKEALSNYLRCNYFIIMK